MFIKQLMVIGTDSDSITTERAFDISGEFDMDAITGTMSCKLPLVDKNNETYFENSDLIYLKTLPRYTAIKLYYQKFDIDPGDITTDDLVLIFNGYLDKLVPTRNKTDYSLSLECVGTLGFANQMSHPMIQTEAAGIEWFADILSVTGFFAIIPATDVIYRLNDATRDLTVKWAGGNNLKEIFESMNDQYGIKIHQRGDGKVVIFDAFSLYDNDLTEWELKLGTSAFSIEYGDQTARVDRVIVIGYEGRMGIAVNPLAAVDKQATWDGIINNNAYRTEVFYNQTTADILELEAMARNILFDKMKNNIITVKTLLDPTMNVMDFAKVSDGEFYEDDLFIIKTVSWTLSKTDCSVSLTCFKSPLALAPANLVTDTEGFTDLRALEIYKEDIEAGDNVW